MKEYPKEVLERLNRNFTAVLMRKDITYHQAKKALGAYKNMITVVVGAMGPESTPERISEAREYLKNILDDMRERGDKLTNEVFRESLAYLNYQMSERQ